MHGIEYYKKKFINAGYLVPESKQEYFFKANNLKVKKLDNGAFVVSINFPQKYIVQSHLELFLPSGAVTDPNDKSGLAHFYEHVMFTNKPLLKKFDDNRLSYNASTSSTSLKSYIRGIYNPAVSTYGIGSVLNEWITNFYYPRSLNSSRIIQEERNVILSEIHNYYSNFENMVWDNIDKIILHKTNYRLDKTLGTAKSLNNITKNDLMGYNTKYVIPKNTIVKISSAGPKNEGDILTKQIIGKLDKVNKPGKKFTFDRTKYSKHNILKPGKMITKFSDVGKNQVAYGLTWGFKAVPFTTQEEAFYEFKKIFLQLIRRLVREKLNVYTFRLESVFLFPDYTNLHFFCIQDSNNTQVKVEKLQELTLIALNKLNTNKKIVNEHLDLTQEFYKSKVYNTEEIINEVIDGFLIYGLPGDVNYFKKARAKVKPSHIHYFVEEMLKTPPTPFAIGDIK